MIIFRSQSVNNNQTKRTDMEVYNDNDSDISLHEISSVNLNIEINNEQMVKHERDPKKVRIEPTIQWNE